MCGIAGIITRAPTTPEEIACVMAANSRLAHRGPDGSGEFQDLNVTLARRLSDDLTGGWQPSTTKTDTRWLPTVDPALLNRQRPVWGIVVQFRAVTAKLSFFV